MRKKTIRNQLLLAGVAFGLIILLFGLWVQYNSHSHPQELNLKSGTAFPEPRVIKSFELQTAPSGPAFTNAQLKGHWSMLFFGFTHCALLCPTTLSSLNQFYGNLTADKVLDLPHVYFISIDPERDSLKRIHLYVTAFNKNFRGATGTEAALDAMTQSLNILFAKVNPNHDEDYQIDHSGTVLVFNPQGNLAALFSPPIDPKIMAEDYKALIKHAGGK